MVIRRNYMYPLLAIAAFIVISLRFISGECPNACSAHGRCGAYDMCTCYRNWMANDCSQRVCPFGMAHVDSPKGDLNSDGGSLSNSETVVVVGDQLYPYGTTEQFPEMVDSDGNYLDNTAHEYRECSNKGLCDRSTGLCSCFEGYEGNACQRASCPSTPTGICSGHGTCKTIKELAADDFDNQYKLWDEYTTMGCTCDPGYFGPDCSYRNCKFGFDPIYDESYQNVRYSNYTFQIYTQSPSSIVEGNYSLIFYDANDHEWQTDPISYDASCDDIVAALEALPNKAVHRVLCYSAGGDYSDNEIEFSGINIVARYTLALPMNPGRLKQMDINIYLDGKRATLFSNETSSTLGYHIYPNGFVGEYTDYVNTECSGVLVSLQHFPGYDVLTTQSASQTKLLKKCLGGADGSSSNNVEVYNWDYGTVNNPHLVRLIDSTQDNTGIDLTLNPSLAVYPVSRLCDSESDYLQEYGSGWCYAKDPPGFYVAMYYNGSDFIVLNRPGVDYSSSTTFHLYTTTGYLQVVNNNTRAFTHTTAMSDSDVVDYSHSNTLYLYNTTNSDSDFYGQVDCATVTTGDYGSSTCIDKDDFVMILNEQSSSTAHSSNPVYLNLYQVKKIFREERSYAARPVTVDSEIFLQQVHLDYGLNTKYTWAGGPSSGYGDTSALLYKFVLPTDGSEYNYAATCSNRGLCDYSTGLCQCFKGYTNDDCGTQNALAQ